jgi:hypothetical protein
VLGGTRTPNLLIRRNLCGSRSPAALGLTCRKGRHRCALDPFSCCKYNNSMPDINKKPLIPRDLVRLLHEYMFRGWVENGRLEIKGRTSAQIIDDYDRLVHEYHDQLTSGEVDFLSTTDHRSTLFDEARKAAEDAHYELAITLYAVWLEHFINGTLKLAFHRLGHGEDISVPLIKELRLATKVTVLWKIAGLPDIDQDSLRLINRVIELRNAFVHYKWQNYDEPTLDRRDEQSQQVAEEAERLVSTLLGIESAVFWNGREEELIDCFREESRRRLGDKDKP